MAGGVVESPSCAFPAFNVPCFSIHKDPSMDPQGAVQIRVSQLLTPSDLWQYWDF